LKCNECGNTTEFNIYSNFCYEVTLAENGGNADIEKSDEFFEESIPIVFCRLCDSDNVEYSKQEFNKLFELSYI